MYAFAWSEDKDSALSTVADILIVYASTYTKKYLSAFYNYHLSV